MRWVPDASGRLPERPHYLAEEIDRECESRVAAFLRGRYGQASFPLTTNDLTVLLEQHASDLDLYADLTAEGAGVEGMTELVADAAPRVQIAEALSTDPARELRLRMTLAHELGHVWLHAFLWREATPGRGPQPRCSGESIRRAPASDWLEWQAGYAGGAILMPRSALQRMVAESQAAHAFRVTPDTVAGEVLISRVERTFQVSRLAARVRLAATGLMGGPPVGRRNARQVRRTRWSAGAAVLGAR